jgi:ATP-binding cassette subfamily B protein
LFLHDLQVFLCREPERREGGTSPPVAAPSELQVHDLHFTYPGTAREVLEGIDMTLRAGEVVALVGENGSGKTTLAKLLAHALAPTKGQLIWNGVDTRTLDPRAVRRQVAVIFQDFIRYHFTAGENIGIGDPDRMHDLDRVHAAARRAGADSFIARLPEDYQSVLGKVFGGYDLSGGQWQRVALARGFFRDAGLLVLDEPTASMDPRAEHELFDRMRDLAEGRIVLLISHRFSTVRSADRIYVLHEGKIVEQGNHDDLIAVGGRYAELFSLQATAYR